MMPRLAETAKSWPFEMPNSALCPVTPGSAADSSKPAWQWQQRPSLRCQTPQKVATSPPSSEQRCEEDNIRNSFSQLNSYICGCNLTPKCRHDHRLKQHPRWHVYQLPDGTFQWTTPSGRAYTTEPTRYPSSYRRG